MTTQLHHPDFSRNSNDMMHSRLQAPLLDRALVQ